MKVMLAKEDTIKIVIVTLTRKSEGGHDAPSARMTQAKGDEVFDT